VVSAASYSRPARARRRRLAGERGLTPRPRFAILMLQHDPGERNAMPRAPDFEADELNIQTHTDGQRVRLRFSRDSGGHRLVTIRRSNLPTLLSVLQREIPPGAVVPIDRASLQAGTNYRLEGYGVQKQPDGGAMLTFHIELLDQGRGVSLPLRLSAQEVTDILRRLA
jgi:hypothetical protein